MANYYMYNPEKPGVVYPMKADKKKATFDSLTGKNVTSKTCPKCARKMAKRKKICKCGYTRPAAPSQAKYRWLALLFLVVAALAIVAIPYTAMYSMAFDAEVGSYVIDTQKVSLLTMITSGMTANIFGFLPAFAMGNGGEAGLVYTIATYVFVVCAVLAALYALFAVFSFDKAAKRARRALFFLGVGALVYTIMFAVCLNVAGKADAPVAAVTEGVLALGSYSLEMVSALIGVVSLALSFIVCVRSNRVAKLEKKIAKANAKINKAKGL